MAVSVNHLYADKPDDALWFFLAGSRRVSASAREGPTNRRCFQTCALCQLKELGPTKLGGVIEIDPRKQDFFKMVIEERKRTPKRSDISEAEKNRLSGALKVFANSSSYGIFAEMNR